MGNCKICGKHLEKGRTHGACRMKEWRKKNPLKYAYRALRDNAKRRGKEFSISFEYFKKFCIKTEYEKKRGIFKDCYTIDRINPDLGYVEGNLQVLTNSENVKKYQARFIAEWDDHNKEMYFNTKVSPQRKIEGAPF